VTSVSVITPSGSGGKDIELPGEIFESAVNIPLMHQVVVAQEAAARQGTHATKTRGMVRGGGKKPYRQKGTGRARQGSLRAPQYAGGGIVHGPVPRSYAQRTPKKMKVAALRGALSDRLSHGRIAVVSAFVEGEEPSTKGAFSVLCAAIGVTGSRLSRPVLVVVSADDELSRKSLRNVPGARVLDSGQLNTYDVLASDHVVFTEAALGEFVGRVTGAELTVVETAASKPARAKKASTAKAKADDVTPGEVTAGEVTAGEATADEATAGEVAADDAAADRDAASAAGETTAVADKPAAKPARATASRAKKPATTDAAEAGADSEPDEAPPAVRRRSSGTARKSASSGSDAEQTEEQA
jgi:large subunit ribosomal protein L4